MRVCATCAPVRRINGTGLTDFNPATWNGNGKSTLMRLLAGRMKVMDGKLSKSSKLKVGYFAQHQAEELTLSETPYQHLIQRIPNFMETRLRRHLAAFGFPGARADVPCEALSGGEDLTLVALHGGGYSRTEHGEKRGVPT